MPATHREEVNMLIAHMLQSSEPDSAFVHALALAARRGARLVSVHACTGAEASPRAPDPGPLLERWGLAPDAVEYDSLVHECCDDVSDTLLNAFEMLRPDLIVAATSARRGIGRWFSGSVAEGVARNVATPSLLLPTHGKGFVDPAGGNVDLSCIVIAAGGAQETQRAIDAAIALAPPTAGRGQRLLLVHTSDGQPPPTVEVPAGVVIEHHASEQEVDKAVLELARQRAACLVAMATRGHDGFADVLLGSRTERVLHGVQCPLLWVPLAP